MAGRQTVQSFITGSQVPAIHPQWRIQDGSIPDLSNNAGVLSSLHNGVGADQFWRYEPSPTESPSSLNVGRPAYPTLYPSVSNNNYLSLSSIRPRLPIENTQTPGLQGHAAQSVFSGTIAPTSVNTNLLYSANALPTPSQPNPAIDTHLPTIHTETSPPSAITTDNLYVSWSDPHFVQPEFVHSQHLRQRKPFSFILSR